MKAFAALVGVTACSWAVVLCLASCTKTQGREVVTIANEACVLLHGLDPTAEAICATENELAPIVQHLLAARRYKAKNPGVFMVGIGSKGVSAAQPIDPCLVPVTP